MTTKRATGPVEWPTVICAILCYAIWACATTVIAPASLLLAILITAIAVAFHSSLTHEVVHGHPFPGHPLWSALVVGPALGLVIPYLRFKDTHLDHHNDAILTDPYDDPESNYLDPAVWAGLPGWARGVLTANNTLLGRVTLGPAIGLGAFLAGDLRAIRRGDARVIRGWLWHIPALVPVALWLWQVATLPLWAYGVAVYLSLSILKIRTFLEHQAHERASGRTVIIEDRGPLSWMFLNNNLHVVHHMHPAVPWYRLPGLYARNRAHYLRRNGGYAYRSYAEVFRRYFLRRKDPVPHPLR